MYDNSPPFYLATYLFVFIHNDQSMNESLLNESLAAIQDGRLVSFSNTVGSYLDSTSAKTLDLM